MLSPDDARALLRWEDHHLKVHTEYFVKFSWFVHGDHAPIVDRLWTMRFEGATLIVAPPSQTIDASVMIHGPVKNDVAALRDTVVQFLLAQGACMFDPHEPYYYSGDSLGRAFRNLAT